MFMDMYSFLGYLCAITQWLKALEGAKNGWRTFLRGHCLPPRVPSLSATLAVRSGLLSPPAALALFHHKCVRSYRLEHPSGDLGFCFPVSHLPHGALTLLKWAEAGHNDKQLPCELLS